MEETVESHDYMISWQASEYIHHEKEPLWYIIFGAVSAVLLAGTYLLLKDIISIIVVALMAIAVLIFANRKPRSLEYHLDDKGVTINGREYNYGSFKSFSVMVLGAVESVYLEPLERFMPPISIYMDPKDADKIISILGSYLPLRDRQPDMIDRFIHRIRL